MEAPIAKATKSVTDVTVIETPACFIVSATFSGSGFCFSAADRLFQASMITNISSTPKPATIMKAYQLPDPDIAVDIRLHYSLVLYSQNLKWL